MTDLLKEALAVKPKDVQRAMDLMKVVRLLRYIEDSCELMRSDGVNSGMAFHVKQLAIDLLIVTTRLGK